MSINVVAIIPARGGSKGITNKNLQKINNKTLIEWTVADLRSSGLNNIYLSTNDINIAQHGEGIGLKVIYRPETISGDFSQSEEAILHVLETLHDKPDTVIFPQVTSPFRLPNTFKEALFFFEEGDYDSLFSSVLNDYFFWTEEEGRLISKNYNFQNRPMRQQRKTEWIENGSFYIFKYKGFADNKNRLFGKIGTYTMNNFGSNIDINDERDLKLACEIARFS